MISNHYRPLLRSKTGRFIDSLESIFLYVASEYGERSPSTVCWYCAAASIAKAKAALKRGEASLVYVPFVLVGTPIRANLLYIAVVVMLVAEVPLMVPTPEHPLTTQTSARAGSR